MQFIKNTLKSYLFFLISIIITSLLYTIIIYYGNISLNSDNLKIISIIINIILFFVFGIFIGIQCKQKGLMNAFLISLTLIIIIVLIKLLTKTFNSDYLIKALCSIFSASIGGIISVNIYKKKTI
jgi:putative membrane protein (TIGR04086 family)